MKHVFLLFGVVLLALLSGCNTRTVASKNNRKEVRGKVQKMKDVRSLAHIRFINTVPREISSSGSFREEIKVCDGKGAILVVHFVQMNKSVFPQKELLSQGIAITSNDATILPVDLFLVQTTHGKGYLEATLIRKKEIVAIAEKEARIIAP